MEHHRNGSCERASQVNFEEMIQDASGHITQKSTTVCKALTIDLWHCGLLPCRRGRLNSEVANCPIYYNIPFTPRYHKILSKMSSESRRDVKVTTWPEVSRFSLNVAPTSIDNGRRRIFPDGNLRSEFAALEADGR